MPSSPSADAFRHWLDGTLKRACFLTQNLPLDKGEIKHSTTQYGSRFLIPSLAWLSEKGRACQGDQRPTERAPKPDGTKSSNMLFRRRGWAPQRESHRGLLPPQLGFCLETSQEPLGGGLEPRPEATAFPERPQGGRGWSTFPNIGRFRTQQAPESSLPPSLPK